MTTFWTDLLRLMETEQSGPEDEPDEDVNGDPDSTLGDDDEMGFNEMVWWPEPLFAEDDGLDDGEGDEEDEWEDDDDEDGEDED